VRGSGPIVMAHDVEVVFSPYDNSPVKLFDADRGHVHETLLFSVAKAIGDDDPARTGRIKAATRTAAKPAMIAAIRRAPEKPAA
jgi:hypothetical protein